MNKHAVMFDLDGTLADTLADIAAAGNHMLAHFGREPIELNRYRYLAGQGARQLVVDALATVEQDPRVDEGVATFKAWQLEYGMDLTQPYAGIAPLLDELTRRKVKLAVLSNKPDAATRAMMTQVFDRWRFDAVHGQRDGMPLKPDPAAALAIARQLKVPASQWLYVGDTRVDMLTARAAGMTAVGVLWGFRDEAELRQAGAEHLITEPMQLLPLLDG